jgi:hypothetical protein
LGTGAPVSGTSNAQAEAAIGGSAAMFSTGEQAIATATGAPVPKGIIPVLDANSNIKAAFNHAGASYFAMGEVGGAYSSGGSGTQTDTSTINLSIDLTQLASRQDLELGLFSGTSSGSGFSSLALTVVGDGNTLVNQTFNTAAAAVAFFTNDAIDLGALSSGPLSGNTLSLTITATLTTTAAGTSFDGGFLIGDPPPAGDAAVHHNFAAAMATFGANGGGSSGTFIPVQRDDHPPMLAVQSA